MNNTMDCVGCPACAWLLCAIFTLMLFCHLPNLNGEIPLAVQTGQIPDISKFMHFHFWQEALVESHQKDKTEELAHWCYPAEGVGDELTYMVLLTELEQLVPRGNVVVIPADAHLCSTLTLHVYCLLQHVSTCVYMAYSYTSAWTHPTKNQKKTRSP